MLFHQFLNHHAHGPNHWYWGDCRIQYLATLDGSYRVSILTTSLSWHMVKDIPTFKKAVEIAQRLHDEAFTGVIWC